MTFVTNKLSRGASVTYRSHFGVGVTEWRIMSLLAIETDIPAQRICQVIGFDKALVSRTVRLLEEQKYVTVTADDHDNRRTVIALTAAGLAVHDQVINAAFARERLLLQDFSEAEVATLLTFLHRMHRSIDAVNAFVPAASK
jgi:DNA-binding MarR family transcriptional regulator